MRSLYKSSRIGRHSYTSRKICASRLIPIHSRIPSTVGNRKLTAVHFQLCVSLRMVSSVVAHGKCTRENIRVQMAVTHVQPLLTNSSFNTARSPISVIDPFARYAMIMIGTTISFAGKPRRKASRMTPSSPIR